MDSERKIIIAFLFKRSGKEEMSPSDLYLPLSMDLQWFSPKQAREFVNSAVEQKLLLKKGGSVKPNFDYKKVVVPIGFHPSEHPFKEDSMEESIKEEKPDVLKTIIDRIVEKTDSDKHSVIEKINMIAKEKNITLEVAALLFSREYDIGLVDCFDEIENKIFRENRE